MNAASGIEDLLDRERLEVDEVLAGIAAVSVARVADPLRAPMEYALSTSGKRVRPILCLAAYRAVVATGRLPGESDAAWEGRLAAILVAGPVAALPLLRELLDLESQEG